MSEEKDIQDLTPEEARNILWESGEIDQLLLDSLQMKMIDAYKNNNVGKELTFVYSRQSGKSWSFGVLAIQECIRRPNFVVLYVAPTLKMCKRITRNNFSEILMTCPKSVRPSFKTQESEYVFPNGSRIILAGFNAGEVESIRGIKAHLVLLDECGFMDDHEFEYGVSSVIYPTMNSTKGTMLMCSTLPKSAAHPYWNRVLKAKIENRCIEGTIYDCPRYSQKEIDNFAERVGGYDSIDFRREYLNELITNEDAAVFPEATKDKMEKIVKEIERPPYYDSYLSMDIGFRDYTAILFGYYDFARGKTVIEDELIVKGTKVTTAYLADEIKKKEQSLWGMKKPYLRVADNNNLILLNELTLHPYNLPIIPTAKDNKEAAINKVRLMIQREEIIIHPRCVNLIQQLQFATWNSKRTDFDRDPLNGHFDACFLAGTRVLTNKGYKNIEDIRQGDMVLTHKGRFRKVNNLMSKDYNGVIFDLKRDGSHRNIKCTEDHRFYIKELKNKRNTLVEGDSDFKTLSQFTKNNRLYEPSIQSDTNSQKSVEMCFLYGHWLAEGSVGGNGYQIEFTVNKKEIKVKEILEKALLDSYPSTEGKSNSSIRRHKLGICKPKEKKVNIYLNKNNNSAKITLSQKTLYEELKKCGKSTYKTLPDFVYDLNPEQSMWLLCGYFFGDGYFKQDGITWSSVSENIIDIIEICCKKNNITPSHLIKSEGEEVAFGYKTNKSVVGRLGILDSNVILNFINSNKILNELFTECKLIRLEKAKTIRLSQKYRKINKLYKEHYVGKVYNLEVDEDESYCVEGIAVHNCAALIYYCRNIQTNRNPYPDEWQMYHESFYANNTKFDKPKDSFQEHIARIFNPFKKKT